MSDSSKTSVVSSIVAAACIIVYVAVLAYGAGVIILDTGERRVLAEREFHDLADRSASAAILGFMSQAYQETITDSLAESKTLRAVIISASGSEYGFERQPGTAISLVGNSPRFKTGFGISSEPYYQPLRIDGQRNATINAVYTSIDYDLLLRTLKNTLILVLAALAAAVFTLMIELVMKNRDAYYEAPSARVSTGAAPGAAASETAVAVAAENAAREEDGDLFDIDDDGFEAGAAAPVEEAVVMALPEEEVVVAPGAVEQPGGNSKGGNPHGLYSPRSAVGWESYTEERLDSELHRCASSEQDLTFIVAEYCGGGGDELYRAFAGEAVTFFTLKDLIFEKGDLGLSVILPGVDVDHGLETAKEFHRRIMKKLPEYFAEASDLCVGFSSRSGRLVEAGRVMLEASSALEKAREDPSSPIVGFKSNLDKYREFISKKHV
jgi:hypothetical protein